MKVGFYLNKTTNLNTSKITNAGTKKKYPLKIILNNNNNMDNIIIITLYMIYSWIIKQIRHVMFSLF